MSELIKTYFVEEEHTSELIKILPEDEKYMSLTWQVNNFCNFRCSYCNSGNWSGENPNLGNLEKYKTNLKSMFDQYKSKGYTHFKVFFSGGEPTLWENLIPLIEFLREELPSVTIAINTNLSKPMKYWVKYAHMFDDIVASFHVEYCKKDLYIKNAIYLCDKVDYLCTKLLMHDKRFWEVVEFGERIRQEVPNYNLEWTPLFDEMSINTGPWHYADPEKAKFLSDAEFESVMTIPKPFNENKAKSVAYYDNGTSEPVNSNKIIAARQNFFKGWTCNVDDALFIDPTGELSSASCGVGKHHGNILDEDLLFSVSPVVCTKTHCHCGTDIIIPKEKRVD